jgi:hypothetical protein
VLLGKESGREAPARFRLDGYKYLVEEMLDQLYGPEKALYKVRADDGNPLFSANRRPRLTAPGISYRFGNCQSSPSESAAEPKLVDFLRFNSRIALLLTQRPVGSRKSLRHYVSGESTLSMR